MEKKEEVPFEKALKRLETIVDKLEQGDLELEKAIALFEEGNGMAKVCREKLDLAEKKIEKLVKDRDGAPATEPMDDPTGDAPF